MGIGASGRVVIEIDPALKRELHSILARKGMTLKDWFMARVDDCITREAQAGLHSRDRAQGKNADAR